MIFKRRIGHFFPEITTLNDELTIVKREVLHHSLEALLQHRDTKIKARGWNNFLSVWMYEISAEQYC
jgi:hypothetical protein